jgi:hypothetical protein
MQSFEDLINLPQTEPLAIRPEQIEIPGERFQKYLADNGFKLLPNAKGLWAYFEYSNLGFIIIIDRKLNKTFLRFGEYTTEGRKITFYPLCSPEQMHYDEFRDVFDKIYSEFSLSPVVADLPDTVTKIPGNLYRFFTRRDGDLDLDFTSNIVRISQRVSGFISSI